MSSVRAQFPCELVLSNARFPLIYPDVDGRVDCFGLPRDESGSVVWKIDSGDGGEQYYTIASLIAYPYIFTVLRVGDALAICELDSMHYPLMSMGLDQPILHPGDDTVLVPKTFFLSSPNSSTLPNIAQDGQRVYIRTNGRFWTHDYTLWPHWYFPGTWYLCFVRRRPLDDELVHHSLHMIWYDLQPYDYVREPGSIADVVRIPGPMVEELMVLRKELSDKIDDLIAQRPADQLSTFRDLRFAQNGMRMTSVLLSFAAQTRMMTLLNFTTFQRFYLEALAIYEYFTKWEPLKLTLGDTPLPVDDSIIGLVTADLLIAQEHYHLGVPVWLVRRAAQMTTDVIVREVVTPCTNFPGMVREIYEGSICVFESWPTPLRNRVSVSLCVANIEIGPQTRELHPGDPQHAHPQNSSK